MEGKPLIIQREIKGLVPASVISSDIISCFVFYDNHPQDEKHIDITICTTNGELREYYQRDLVSSLPLDPSTTPKEIIILRNSSSELFYVVSCMDEIFIVSSKKTLKIHTKIPSVDKYTVNDLICSGKAQLKITKKDDAVPIVFDENFLTGEDLFHNATEPESLPLLSELKRKCIEAQYNNRNHEQSIKEYIEIRHAVTLCTFQNLHPNHVDSVFKSSSNVYGNLKVRTTKPWIGVCNGKMVIAFEVVNEYDEPLEDLHMLLKSATTDSLSYTTKLLDYLKILPYWKEHTKILLPKSKAAVVAVMSFDEVKPNVTSRIILMGALSYKTSQKTFLKPLEDVLIPSMVTLTDELTSLSTSNIDNNTMIAVVSTTVKTELRVKLLSNPSGLSLIELLAIYLEMKRVGENILLYDKTPYHILNGCMLHFTSGTLCANVSAYTRSKSQLLALIHCINDSMLSNIIITTSNYIMSAKKPELSGFSDLIPEKPEKDYSGYANTILNRTKTILEYLDLSMMKMSESKNPEVISQIGYQTDLYACGVSGYKEFRDKMIEEARKGVEFLTEEPGSSIEPMATE